MRILKRPDGVYEVEFNEKEEKQLENIEQVFRVEPVEVIRKSIAGSLEQCSDGLDYLLNVVADFKEKDSGNSST